MSIKVLYPGWWFLAVWCAIPVAAADLPWIVVSPDQKGFVNEATGTPFVPWGFNYDHDESGRLIEDYWETDWDKVVRDFRSMKGLGANVVRIHIQLGKFMTGPRSPDREALHRLGNLVKLAEEVGLYIDLTGLGCYHKADVPEWYDPIDELTRWDVQALFWKHVAETCSASPALFCYDLMNEPVVSGGKRPGTEWLGPAFAGKHFVQFITLDQKDRPRPQIAREWIRHLIAGIREKDKQHLVTVGLVDWSLDRPGITSGFVPNQIAADLDFLCVHLYPESGKLDDALKTLQGFAVGKPVIIEETFPLKCSMAEFTKFIELSSMHSAGCIGFFWGQRPEDLRNSTTITDAIVRAWLEFFEARANSLEVN